MAETVLTADRSGSQAATMLLSTKLFIPQARQRQDVLLRPRLIERLKTGSVRQLTLISAPAGFGKTTLLAEWIPHSERCVCWLSLDETDNDLTRFLAYLIAALQLLKAEFGQVILGMLHAPQPPPLESLMTTLVNEIIQTLAEFALVLDDYHLIHLPAIHAAVAFLLNHLPPNMHLILTSRADPALPLARLRVRGQLTELRAADLRFTPDEATTFFHQIKALPLPAAQIEELETRTEGWGAGLHLAALSLQGLDTVGTARFIRDFTGSHHHVFDYLTEEVLQQQSEEIQRFLLYTSILDRLCDPLCDAVLGKDESGTLRVKDENSERISFSSFRLHPSSFILEYLEHANLFLVPLDGERRWYRYHHLFANFLRDRLTREVGAVGVAALHCRASRWYEQEGLVDEAINHALAGHDFEQAVRLIELVHIIKWQAGEIKTLQVWLATLPVASWRTHPRLWLVQAWASITVGEFSEADEKLRGAEEALAFLDEESARSLRPEVLALRASYASLIQDPSAVELAQQALRELPKDYWLRGILVVFLGAAYYTMGDLNAAATVLSQGPGSTLSTPGPQPHQIHLLVFDGMVHHAKGRLQDARALMHRALELAEPGGQPIPFVGTLFAYMSSSLVLYELGELDQVEVYLTRCADQAVKLGSAEAQIFALSGLARICLARDDLAAAASYTNQVDTLLQAQALASGIMAYVEYHRFQLLLKQGNLAAATAWAETHSDQSSPLNPYAFHRLALPQILIAQGRFETALDKLAVLIQEAEVTGHGSLLIKALVLQALTFQAYGSSRQALTTLEQALTLAEPEGYIRPFVDEGLPMAALLHEAHTRAIMPAYVTRLLAAFPEQDKATRRQGDKEKVELDHLVTQSPSHLVTPTLIEPLSKRELEILSLMAQGLTNPEIGQQIFISDQTVKVHTRNIFGKLDVNSRRQAVAKARALGLLP